LTDALTAVLATALATPRWSWPPALGDRFRVNAITAEGAAKLAGRQLG
jgi:hypothetical protein